MKYQTIAFFIGVSILLSGCAREHSEPLTPEGPQAQSVPDRLSQEVNRKLPSVSSTLPSALGIEKKALAPPLPETKVGKDEAIAIAKRSFQDAGLIGFNGTRFDATLVRWQDKLVWQVSWIYGKIQIATSSGSITVDAETGDVLHIYKSPRQYR